MQSTGNYLAIDLGASSGRAVIGTLDGPVMRMQEIHRFPTPLIERDGHLYWDVDAIWNEILTSLQRASEVSTPQSISVDSWGVDYVPLDTNGIALRNPYCYRDPRTEGRLETAIRLVGSADALYDATGIQFLAINTLPQIIADLEDEPDLVERTATRLLIAEYFLYCLSGRRAAEVTMASTTQLIDARTGEWSRQIVNAIGDDISRWPEIVQCGAILGSLLPEHMPGRRDHLPAVVAGCAHDTAAAVAAIPASPNTSWCFISSGTWSLIGVELDAPILTAQARNAGFTNEAGIDKTVRFLTNRAGMWVLEECRREWQAQGIISAHESIFHSASTAQSMGHNIDLNAPQFATRGDMLTKLDEACRQGGLQAPTTVGETTRLILESLATSHATALNELESITGRRIDIVHVVGGGSMNDFLNQLTADYSGRRVIAGPEEATVLGNLLVQARTLGHLPAGVSVRDAARSSTHVREFTPRQHAQNQRAVSVSY